MIKNSFLKKQIENAQKKRKTPEVMRRMALLVVDRVLRTHYGKTYPIKCLQSSIAIGMVLEKFQIRSKAFVGAVCVSQVFEEESCPPTGTAFGERITMFGHVLSSENL